MKRLMLIALATFATFTVSADNWVFTPGTKATEGDVTDGVWKFKATIKSGTTDITIGNVYTNVCPAEVIPLDFSKPVTDGA